MQNQFAAHCERGATGATIRFLKLAQVSGRSQNCLSAGLVRVLADRKGSPVNRVLKDALRIFQLALVQLTHRISSRRPRWRRVWKCLQSSLFVDPHSGGMHKSGGAELLVVTLQTGSRPTNPCRGSFGRLWIAIVLVQFIRATRSLKIAASCFFPEPEVDSACVVLQRRPNPCFRCCRITSFTDIVKQSFSQRRKMMFKLLKEHWGTHGSRELFRTPILRLCPRRGCEPRAVRGIG